MPSHAPREGEVWDINLDPPVGREQGGIRPVLVISADVFNDIPNGLHIVVPITGTNRNVRAHLPVRPPEGGLTKPSVVMCDQVRAVSELRFLRRRGVVPEDLLFTVQRLVGESIAR